MNEVVEAAVKTVFETAIELKVLNKNVATVSVEAMNKQCSHRHRRRASTEVVCNCGGYL